MNFYLGQVFLTNESACHLVTPLTQVNWYNDKQMASRVSMKKKQQLNLQPETSFQLGALSNNARF